MKTTITYIIDAQTERHKKHSEERFDCPDCNPRTWQAWRAYSTSAKAYENQMQRN